MLENKSSLKEKTLAELKNIATKEKIKFSSKIKKDELMKLILEYTKFKETVEIKKEQFTDNNSSSINTILSNNQKKEDFFINTPDLPDNYNKDMFKFMVRDPNWGFVYWEISSSLKQKHNLSEYEKILRCYDISNSKSPDHPDSFFDLKINEYTNNWYINFPVSNRTYIIDYGYIKDGKFITVIRSNAGTLPRSEISDQVDVEWMINDELYKNLLIASGVDQLFQQVGSQELMKFLAGNIYEKESLSSGMMPSSNSSPFGASFSK